MIPIPRKSSADAKRMIDEHKECIDSMKGVAGNSVLKCATPGDTTTVTGGIHEDFQLNRVLLRMRAQPAKGKLVVICTKIEKEWRIARLVGHSRRTAGIRHRQGLRQRTGSPARHLPDAPGGIRGDRRFPGALPRGMEAPRR